MSSVAPVAQSVGNVTLSTDCPPAERGPQDDAHIHGQRGGCLTGEHGITERLANRESARPGRTTTWPCCRAAGIL